MAVLLGSDCLKFSPWGRFIQQGNKDAIEKSVNLHDIVVGPVLQLFIIIIIIVIILKPDTLYYVKKNFETESLYIYCFSCLFSLITCV